MPLVSLLSTTPLQVTKCSPIRLPRSSITAVNRQSPLHAPRLTPTATEKPLPSQTLQEKACVTLLNITGTAQPSVARSVTDDLVLPATMSAEQPSAQGSALTASGSVGTTTADGCIWLRPPDDRNQLHAGRRKTNPHGPGKRGCDESIQN